MSTLSPERIAELDALDARMSAAWSLVNPVSRTGSWRSPIEVSGARGAFEAALTALGVTWRDVREAVAHYTATELRATLSVRDGRLDVRLTAPGYAAGPAGDH